MKHALLAWMLRALQRKSGALFVLDTHAGAGRYRLDGDEATRTGEWRDGIGRLLAGDRPEALADYLALVESGDAGFYPGSPLLIRRLLRAQDRLACCELHPEEHAMLRRLFLGDGLASVHARDGWQAIGALLPPRMGAPRRGAPRRGEEAAARRGLVLIDPPFEQPGEFTRLADAIGLARRRFAGCVVAAWYPIKHRAPVRAFHDHLRQTGEPDLLATEIMLRPPLDAAKLNGCGLLVASPPWGFEPAATAILDAIADRSGETQARGAITRLTPECRA